MDDLISRRAAIDEFYHIKCNLQMMDDTHTADKMMHGLYLAENAVKLLPSAQRNKTCEFWDGESNYCALNRPSAQDVIRCKNCKWYDLRYPFGTVVADAFYCKVNDKFYDDSHFCGYGERREQ